MRHSVNASLKNLQVGGGHSPVCGSVWLTVSSVLKACIFSEEVLFTYISVWLFASDNLSSFIVIIMVRTKNTDRCRKGKQVVN